MKNLSKYFFYLFILCFVLNIQARSDSVTDLQIEGMSVGDSILDYFSKDQIKKNFYSGSKKFVFSDHKSSKFKTYEFSLKL